MHQRTAPNPTRIHVTQIKEMPKCKHWAIITEDKVEVSGYNQGDPSSWDTILRYMAYTVQAEWETAVKELAVSKRDEPFQALVVEVPTVTVTAEVSIK
jgi:hypothetical protein